MTRARRAVRNGMAEIEQLSPQVPREFSTRRRQIEERERELVAAGVQVGDGGREAIAHATRSRKRYISRMQASCDWRAPAWPRR